MGAGSTRVVVTVAALRFGLLNDITDSSFSLLFDKKKSNYPDKIVGRQCRRLGNTSSYLPNFYKIIKKHTPVNIIMKP
jgi:hypothetical protein